MMIPIPEEGDDKMFYFNDATYLHLAETADQQEAASGAGKAVRRTPCDSRRCTIFSALRKLLREHFSGRTKGVEK